MDAPFDRGEVDRASLDATERLRARLSSRPTAPAPPRRSGVIAWTLAAGLFVFSAGMIANPWFENEVRGRLPFAADAGAPEVAGLAERLAALETRGLPGGAAAASPGAAAEAAAEAAAAPAAAERLARTEERVETSSDQLAREADRIDRLTGEVARLTALIESDRLRSEAASTAATSAAARAEAMLALVLARRAIEAGRPLGAIEAPLRQGFEPRYPGAVAAVTALGAAPVTLATLARDFDRLRPAIGAAAPGARRNWWQTLVGTVEASVTSGQAAAAAGWPDAAAAALARGDSAAAAAAVRRLGPPRNPAVRDWLAAVDRRTAGLAGLATLEAAVTLPAAAG